MVKLSVLSLKNKFLISMATLSLSMPALSFAELGSTIFSFDGHDFIRTDTTLINENGGVAINTKLDHNNPGYKALLKKKSYSGKVTLFGKEYDSNYAPLTDKNGKLIGALNVFIDID